MVRVRRTSAPLLAAAVVAAVAVACSLGSGAYAAAEQEAVGAGAGAGVDDLWLRQPPITRGLSLDFYKRSCPRAASIVRHFVRDAVRKDVGLAAGLLRLHFHDCFVQGCDASVLLDGSATGPGEQQAPDTPPVGLQGHQRHPRPAGARVPRRRGVLLRHPGARRARLRGGLRRSGVPRAPRAPRQPAVRHAAGRAVRPPRADVHRAVPPQRGRLARPRRHRPRRALRRAHHAARALHLLRGPPLPAPRPDHELGLPRQAEADVPTDRRTPLDVRTPDVFDNKYCVNLVNREGLFVSDQDLFTNANTRPIASSSASPAASGTSSTSSACPW
uniref:Peroxidase n=1 Tax=Hordeum vulgare subsp. vulgare TaxID=112509 RepID=A0A8I6Y2X6_HORVV